MDPAIIQTLSNFGLGGLFFFMWWSERRDNENSKKDTRLVLDTLKITQNLVVSGHSREDALLRIVVDNTQAMTKLGERIDQLFERRMNPRENKDESQKGT